MPHIRKRITAELESGTLLFDKVTTTAHNTVSMKSEIESEVDEEDDDNSSAITSFLSIHPSSIVSWENLSNQLQLVLPKNFTYMIEQLQECQPRDFMGAPNAPFKLLFVQVPPLRLW